MFCHKCGMENPEEANHCSSCGEQLKVRSLNDEPSKISLLKENIVSENIKDKQVRSPIAWSILVTIFGFFTCCINPVSIVVGIIAIVFSSRVDEKQRKGDYIGAEHDAKTAMILNWVGFGFLVLAAIVIGIFIILGVLKSDDINTYKI